MRQVSVRHCFKHETIHCTSWAGPDTRVTLGSIWNWSASSECSIVYTGVLLWGKSACVTQMWACFTKVDSNVVKKMSFSLDDVFLLWSQLVLFRIDLFDKSDDKSNEVSHFIATVLAIFGNAGTPEGVLVNPIRTKEGGHYAPHYYRPPHLFGRCGTSAMYSEKCAARVQFRWCISPVTCPLCSVAM